MQARSTNDSSDSIDLLDDLNDSDRSIASIFDYDTRRGNLRHKVSQNMSGEFEVNVDVAVTKLILQHRGLLGQKLFNLERSQVAVAALMVHLVKQQLKSSSHEELCSMDSFHELATKFLLDSLKICAHKDAICLPLMELCQEYASCPLDFGTEYHKRRFNHEVEHVITWAKNSLVKDSFFADKPIDISIKYLRDQFSIFNKELEKLSPSCNYSEIIDLTESDDEFTPDFKSHEVVVDKAALAEDKLDSLEKEQIYLEKVSLEERKKNLLAKHKKRQADSKKRIVKEQQKDDSLYAPFFAYTQRYPVQPPKKATRFFDAAGNLVATTKVYDNFMESETDQ